jgi:hypothetical protein
MASTCESRSVTEELAEKLLPSRPTIGSRFSRNMVAKDGVEPPTPAFSGLYALGLNPFSINNLIRQGGHSFVTTL